MGFSSKYFSREELECHCGNHCMPENGIDDDLLEFLDALRDKLDESLTLSCAYRCPAHNAAVGGVENSQHTQGTAADIIVPDDMTVDELADTARSMGIGGVGRYHDAGFVHVDVRPYEADWEG